MGIEEINWKQGKFRVNLDTITGLPPHMRTSQGEAPIISYTCIQI